MKVAIVIDDWKWEAEHHGSEDELAVLLKQWLPSVLRAWLRRL